MLLSEKVEIVWGNRNKNYYIPKGYVFTKNGDSFICDIKDVSIGSRASIIMLCDYCKINITAMQYNEYNKRKRRQVNKDCCKNCGDKKGQDSNIAKYGVSHCSKIESVKEKQKSTIRDNYMKNNNITIDSLKSEFAKKDAKLLTTDFINCTQLLKFICNKHINKGEQNISYRNFKRTDNCCRSCTNEKLNALYKFTYDEVKIKFDNVGLILLDSEYINVNKPLLCKCLIHNYTTQKISLAHLTSGGKCGICAKESVSGENHHNWKGGISTLCDLLRGRIKQWKKASMKECEYKCVLTNKKFDRIHHLYSFNLIMDEAIFNCNFNKKYQVSDYSDNELKLLTKNIQEIHIKYPLGICLIKELHNLFHVLYKYGDNTPLQFEEFKSRLKSGEFDTFLNDHNIKLAI